MPGWQYDWLQAGRFLSFALFLLLGLRVARSRGDGRRRAIVLFGAYVVVLHLLAGITQIDNWPFPNHLVAIGRTHGDGFVMSVTELRGVDRDGREWKLDPQTWSPVYYSILQAWLASHYPQLSPADQRVAARFLVARANGTRERLRAGRRIGFERLLGPLAIGYWWRLPRVQEMPPSPFTAIRVYEVDWTLGEMASAHRYVRPYRLLLELRG